MGLIYDLYDTVWIQLRHDRYTVYVLVIPWTRVSQFYEVTCTLRANVQVPLLRHHYTCGGASQTKIHKLLVKGWPLHASGLWHWRHDNQHSILHCEMTFRLTCSDGLSPTSMTQISLNFTFQYCTFEASWHGYNYIMREVMLMECYPMATDRAW